MPFLLHAGADWPTDNTYTKKDEKPMTKDAWKSWVLLTPAITAVFLLLVIQHKISLSHIIDEP